jgi:putative peptidoglycan lipid II flippase
VPDHRHKPGDDHSGGRKPGHGKPRPSGRFDGPRPEGQRFDGPRFDGPRPSGRPGGFEGRSGPSFDGPRFDGPRFDAPRQEGGRSEGPIPYRGPGGQRSFGPRPTGRPGGPESAGRPRRLRVRFAAPGRVQVERSSPGWLPAAMARVPAASGPMGRARTVLVRAASDRAASRSRWPASRTAPAAPTRVRPEAPQPPAFDERQLRIARAGRHPAPPRPREWPGRPRRLPSPAAARPSAPARPRPGGFAGPRTGYGPRPGFAVAASVR